MNNTAIIGLNTSEFKYFLFDYCGLKNVFNNVTLYLYNKYLLNFYINFNFEEFELSNLKIHKIKNLKPYNMNLDIKDNLTVEIENFSQNSKVDNIEKQDYYVTDFLNKDTKEIIYVIEQDFVSLKYVIENIDENIYKIEKLNKNLLENGSILKIKVVYLNFIEMDILNIDFFKNQIQNVLKDILFKNEKDEDMNKIKDISNNLEDFIIDFNFDDYIYHLENEYKGIINLNGLSNKRLNEIIKLNFENIDKKMLNTYKKNLKKYYKLQNLNR